MQVLINGLDSKRWIFLNRPPWRIRNLKYLEIKIEERPSRAKWGQAGPNRTKWCQMVPNGAKQGQTGPNWVKRYQKRTKKSLTGPNVAKRANGAKWGQMGLYRAGEIKLKPNKTLWCIFSETPCTIWHKYYVLWTVCGSM